MRFGQIALGLRGVVGRWLGAGVGLDVRFALLSFETIKFVAQALVLGLRGAQVGGDGFDQVEQAQDEVSGALVRKTTQIKVVKHGSRPSAAIRSVEALYIGAGNLAARRERPP